MKTFIRNIGEVIVTIVGFIIWVIGMFISLAIDLAYATIRAIRYGAACVWVWIGKRCDPDNDGKKLMNKALTNMQMFDGTMIRKLEELKFTIEEE